MADGTDVREEKIGLRQNFTVAQLRHLYLTDRLATRNVAGLVAQLGA